LADKSLELSWKQRIKMALDIATALLFLHKKKCLHRDLKCENVLVEVSADENSESFGRCKLADFGLSTLFVKDGKPMDEVGTPWWRAPEVAAHHYDMSADIFSFGVVLYELILRCHGEDIRVEMSFERKPLVFGVDPSLLRKPRSEFAHDLSQCPRMLLELAEKCCEEDPLKRPSTEEVVERLHEMNQLAQKLHNYSLGVLRHMESSVPDMQNQQTGASAMMGSSPSQLSVMARQALRHWTQSAMITLSPETDVSSQRVSFRSILDSLGGKFHHSTGRILDERSKEFLASVIEEELDSQIDISQFAKFFNWFHTTGRVIHHPCVLPLFRDSVIDGFISATTCTKLLVDQQAEGNFIIRFSSSKPGCLVITCLHGAQLRHVLVTVDFFEALTTGCFVIGNQRCTTLRQVFTKNNLHVLSSVYPNEPMSGPKFQKAFEEVEEFLRKEQKKEASAGYRQSTGAYDELLHGDKFEVNLFRQLKAEVEKHGSSSAIPYTPTPRNPATSVNGTPAKK
jgi:serine/threonine protein kinase